MSTADMTYREVVGDYERQLSKKDTRIRELEEKIRKLKSKVLENGRDLWHAGMFANKANERIREFEEEINDYKEGTEGLKLCVGDLRDERDRLRKALEEIKETIPDVPRLPIVCEILDIATEALKEGEDE